MTKQAGTEGIQLRQQEDLRTCAMASFLYVRFSKAAAPDAAGKRFPSSFN